MAKRFSKRVPGVICTWLLLLLGCWSMPAMADQYPSVSGPVWTNGQFQFKLGGTAGAPYVIESSPDLINWQPVVTNTDPTNSRVIQIAGSQDVKFFRARTFVFPQIHIGVGAVGNINFSGTGIITDSYNSADTNLSTGGQYDPAKTSTNGNVASVGGIVAVGNHTIEGNLYLGPFASYTGASGNLTGTIYSDANVSFPDVSLPNVNWQTAPLNAGVHTFTNSGYFAISDSLPINIPAGITVILDVTNPTSYSPLSIQIHGGMTNSGTAIIYLNGPPSVTLVANSATDASNQAQNLYYYGLPSLTSISYGALSPTFTGIVYAPEAGVTLNGGGATGLNLIGSFIFGSLTVNGHIIFHYDEHLSVP